MLLTKWIISVVCSSLLILGVFSEECTLLSASDQQYLDKLKPLFGQRLAVTTEPNADKPNEKYTYKLGICVDADDDHKGLGIGLLQSKDGSKELPHVVGKYTATQLMGNDNWIFMKYKDGDLYNNHCKNKSADQHRHAHIMIICDPAVEVGPLKMIEENTDETDECYYLFQFNTKYICTPEPPEALSAGSVFCIVFFVFVLIYLIIGFLYQRIVVGTKGLEQIPNFSFWKEFGKLQADGCDFLCRCGERQEMKMYRGIDDQLLNTERRDEPDDHLLAM